MRASWNRLSAAGTLQAAAAAHKEGVRRRPGRRTAHDTRQCPHAGGAGRARAGPGGAPPAVSPALLLAGQGEVLRPRPRVPLSRQRRAQQALCTPPVTVPLTGSTPAAQDLLTRQALRDRRISFSQGAVASPDTSSQVPPLHSCRPQRSQSVQPHTCLPAGSKPHA